MSIFTKEQLKAKILEEVENKKPTDELKTKVVNDHQYLYKITHSHDSNLWYSKDLQMLPKRNKDIKEFIEKRLKCVAPVKPRCTSKHLIE